MVLFIKLKFLYILLCIDRGWMYAMKTGNLDFIDDVDSFGKTAKTYETNNLQDDCYLYWPCIDRKNQVVWQMLSRSASIGLLEILCPTIKFGISTVRMMRTHLLKSQCTQFVSWTYGYGRQVYELAFMTQTGGDGPHHCQLKYNGPPNW